jgi:hypothetical protein
MARSTTRPPSTRPATVVAPMDDFEPIALTTGVPADLVEREPFFSVDGKMFTIPRQAPANLSMVYLKTLRNAGADKAVQVIMDQMLGPEAIDALAECGSITDDQMAQLMRRIQLKVEGLMEKVTGN